METGGRPRSTWYKELRDTTQRVPQPASTKMVSFSSFFVLLLSSVLVTASVIPLAELKREVTDLNARHVRPDYGAMNEVRHVRPDYGAMSEVRHVRPDYGAMSEVRDEPVSDQEIDWQHPSNVAP